MRSNIFCLLVAVLSLALFGCSDRDRGSGPSSVGGGGARGSGASVGDRSTPGAWQKLGSRILNFDRDRDTIIVPARGQGLRALQLGSEGAGVEIYDVTVTFDNGTNFSPDLRLRIEEGGRSRAIELPGGAPVVRKVDFSYRSLGGTQGRAVVTLYGR